MTDVTYPPKRCPRCGGPVDVAVIDVHTSSQPYATMPGRWSCRTPGCRPDEPVFLIDEEGA